MSKFPNILDKKILFDNNIKILFIDYDKMLKMIKISFIIEVFFPNDYILKTKLF